jgi:hypothetical protein
MQEIICIVLKFFLDIVPEENGGSAMEKTKAVLLFDAWFKDQGIRKNWFAEQIGVDSASISRWLSGKVKPHRPVRKRIEELTDGAVPMDAWK